MITYYTNYKIPDATIAEAQRTANETTQVQYLAYLRAKDESISIVRESPAVGLIAEVSPSTTKAEG